MGRSLTKFPRIFFHKYRPRHLLPIVPIWLSVLLSPSSYRCDFLPWLRRLLLPLLTRCNLALYLPFFLDPRKRVSLLIPFLFQPQRLSPALVRAIELIHSEDSLTSEDKALILAHREE